MSTANKVAVDASMLVDFAAFTEGATTFAKSASDELAFHEQDSAAAAAKVAEAVNTFVGCGAIAAEKRAGVLEKAASHEGTAALLLKSAEIIAKQASQLREYQTKTADRLASPGAAAPQVAKEAAANGMGGGVGAALSAGESAEQMLYRRMVG